MCYSAKQNLRSLAKRFGVDVDWALFEQVFHRRLQDDEIKFARALEANFQRPQSEIAMSDPASYPIVGKPERSRQNAYRAESLSAAMGVETRNRDYRSVDVGRSAWLPFKQLSGCGLVPVLNGPIGNSKR
jgi:hypothetical protein